MVTEAVVQMNYMSSVVTHCAWVLDCAETCKSPIVESNSNNQYALAKAIEGSNVLRPSCEDSQLWS